MARRLPSLNALRAFEAAARHVSFTLAAAELNVTHAAISRHIRELEAWLGIALFERTGRGVILTPDGAAYGRDLTPAFDRLAEATSRHAVRRPTPRLSVSAEPSFATLWLLPRLGAFAAAHPEVDLVLNPSEILVDFSRDGVDLAIRSGTGPWPGAIAVKLLDSDLFPVCCPDLLKDGAFATVKAMAGATLLHDDTKQVWGEWLAAAGFVATMPTKGPILGGYLAISAAENGQGFALADLVTAADGLLDGRLVRPFETSIRRGAYWFARPETVPESPAAQAFCQWLRQELADTLAQLAARPATIIPVQASA